MTDLSILICLGHRIRRYEVHFWAYFETAVRQILREASKELDAVFGARWMEKDNVKRLRSKIVQTVHVSFREATKLGVIKNCHGMRNSASTL